MKSKLSRVANKVADDNERGARLGLLEELFNDFHRSRRQVYWMNFQRGIFFGLGSVLGGVVIIAIVAALLGLFVDLPGGVGDFVERVIEGMERR